MEVHHPHHPSHPKKWREYLLEFFMLFLAVSLGFLAENIREHYVEKQRAHELLESLMSDVDTDIKFMDSLIKRNQKAVMKNDSAILYLMENKRVDLDSFYRLLPAGQYRYLSNTETYDQMKSSGSLRYIKDTALLRKIIAYNNSSKAAQFRSVTQEYDYLANEYVTAIQKWMPAEIAARRHADPYVTSQLWTRLMYTDDNKKLMRKLYDLQSGKKFMLEGKELEALKKELIPVIARKTYLTSASALYLTVTYDHATDLNKYYHNHAE